MKYLLASVILLTTFSSIQAKSIEKKIEYPFQCGALYAIFWKISEAKKEEDNEKSYKSKFDKLALIAEDDFVAAGKSKKEANEYMQKHVDDLVAASARDASLLLGFRKVCDEYLLTR
ncbi:hypothetical protein U0027_23695 [Agrobacterium tumefaciens]|uniref:hypothetical protein n=1 Tax=Agrobacterium tumefaciens TaxID=358 RepID=UPI000E0A55B0|nr:hypothetical protein [Agrobacterium tumefaciens]WQE43186.1 hypothetical protein U0027_23695 [Agrobacterium tumefaciens]